MQLSCNKCKSQLDDKGNYNNKKHHIYTLIGSHYVLDLIVIEI